MESVRHHFLSGAVLAADEHIGVGRADAGDQLEHRPHGFRFPNQRGSGLGAEQAVFRFEPRRAPQGLTQLNLRAQDSQQASIFPGLLYEIARAPAHGLHGERHAAPRRHDHHRKPAVERLNPRQQVQPLLSRSGVARVVQVHQHSVEVARFERGEEVSGRRDRLGLVAFPFQQQAQRLAHVGLIVGDQHARGG